MKSWYSINNKGTLNTDVKISIHDEIGYYGVSAHQFLSDVNAIEAQRIELSIHSPGGNMLDGFAMYNALKNHPAKINARVEGIAASAAATVLMAADYIEMPEDSFLMIHNAQGGAYGESSDLREMADIMEKLQAQAVNIYQNKSGLSEDEIIDMMAAETWMNAAEAKQYGFIDEITGKINVANKADLFSNHFKKLPFNGIDTLNQVKTERDLEKFLRDSGVSKSLAVGFVSRAKSIFRSESEESEQLTALANRLKHIKIPQTLR
jgi:ATP-dependent Clp protease protease subunit